MSRAGHEPIRYRVRGPTCSAVRVNINSASSTGILILASPTCPPTTPPAKLPRAVATTAAETAISIDPSGRNIKFLPLLSFAPTGGPRQGGLRPCRLDGSSVLQTLSCARPPSPVGGSLLNQQRARQWINRPKPYPPHAGITPQRHPPPASLV